MKIKICFVFAIVLTYYFTYFDTISNLQAFLFHKNNSESSNDSSNVLFNITNFQWIRNSEQICSQNLTQTNKILLILIHSARQYYQNRQSVRISYGSLKEYQGYSIQLVFFMGQYDPLRNLSSLEISSEESKLFEEHNTYGDTVIGNFIDSYRNLTYKHAMALKWATTFCSNASWVLKADDDIFIDLYTMIRWRETDLETGNRKCYCVFENPKPVERDGKWTVTISEYPHEFYPEYCYGATYGVDIDMIRQWLYVYQKEKFFWVDDIFFTGIVMRRARDVFGGKWAYQVRNIRESYSGSLDAWSKYCTKELNGTREFGVIVVSSRGNTTEEDMNCLWKIATMEAVNATSNVSTIKPSR